MELLILKYDLWLTLKNRAIVIYFVKLRTLRHKSLIILIVHNYKTLQSYSQNIVSNSALFILFMFFMQNVFIFH